MRAEEGTIADLVAKHPVVRVNSHLLGEVVVFAANNAHVVPEGDEVVYREWELHQLIGVPPDVLKAVHTVKKFFDGELVPAEEASVWEEQTIHIDHDES